MKNCPYCAEAIPDDARQCPFCQTNLANPSGPGAGGNPLPMGASETSGKAIGSLICGILFFFLPSAIVAVILGHLSLSEIRRSAGRLRGHGMAVTGLVFGYIGLAVLPILIIAAIAIPNLLRSRMAANEASAVGSLRIYNVAAFNYATACPGQGYPASTANLGPGPGDCTHANLVDGLLGTSNPTKHGYVFGYMPGPADNQGHVLSYTITADPIQAGSTGVRHFFTDQSGVIRYNMPGPADAESQPIL